ncbi:hypothetical protein F4778DRAFT_167839 [Xylariomycetidae sp. FL2044]|nr:hypothetical protein F4778DRAFT_167839 [Xylariomycetidae sp. FL2044]
MQWHGSWAGAGTQTRWLVITCCVAIMGSASRRNGGRRSSECIHAADRDAGQCPGCCGVEGTNRQFPPPSTSMDDQSDVAQHNRATNRRLVRDKQAHTTFFYCFPRLFACQGHAGREIVISQSYRDLTSRSNTYLSTYL